MEIHGTTAFVTGAGIRIGAAIALALARRGANLVLHYNRSREGAEEVARQVREMGRQALLVRIDQGDWPAVERGCEEIWQQTGGVDALVNNAAIFPKVPWRAIQESDWDSALDVNLKGPFAFARCLGVRMKTRGRGRIVNLSDVLAREMRVNYLPYCIAKAGVDAMTRGLARALAPEVLVNAVAPGAVLFPEEATEEYKQAVLRRVPLARPGSPEDVAQAVVYLIESDYVTGAILPVDGGERLSH